MRAWFYPGDNYGNEFVYPESKALELAKANKQPVPSMPNEQAANTTKPAPAKVAAAAVAMKEAPLKAQKPTEEEVAIAEASPPPAQMASKLPKTAGSLPLLALIGLLPLGTAGLLRRAATALRVENR